MRSDRGPFDAIIIGGGIQGLTLARQASRCGQRVLLLEAAAFGAASTAASYGIVHGGFRYWQSLDLPRLIRSRREQAWYLRRFPGLVRPLRCIMPFYAADRAKPALFALAARLDRLGTALARHAAPDLPAPRLLGQDTLLRLAPWLRGEAVHGAGSWHDVEIVDCVGLVDALVTEARAQGARCLARMKVEQVLLGADGGVAGVLARDALSGEEQAFQAPVVVNCAGADLQTLARGAHPAGPAFFKPVPAFSVFLAHPARLEAAFAIGTGKRLFVRPSAEGLHAGTFYGAQDVPAWRAALDAAAPGLGLGSAKVLRVAAGVVPEGSTALEPAHRDVVLDHGRQGGPRGLFSLSGVKLTTARWLSQQAVARIWPSARAISLRPAGQMQDARA